MAIDGNFLDTIEEKEKFLELVHIQFYKASEEMGVIPHWNSANCQVAYFQWMQDLERIEFVESDVDRPDHIKACALLIYWLRRSSPINDFVKLGDFEDTDTQDFMMKYGREYLAFDLGYRIAHLFECNIHDRSLPQTSFSLESAFTITTSLDTTKKVPKNDFVRSVVHVLKLKNISPHSIVLLLKAIFLRP